MKIKNDSLLKEIENLIKTKEAKNQLNHEVITNKPSDYVGCISKKEAKNLLKEIEQSREEWERSI